jgi:hypothetical protein
MTVKFKIGFTIDSETLFGLMSKMLPIDNLSVEEMVERTPETKFVEAPWTKRPIKRRKPSIPIRLDQGINSVVMAALAEGPVSEVVLRPKIKAHGFSPNSVSSRLQFLQRKGFIERVGDGRWRKK